MATQRSLKPRWTDPVFEDSDDESDSGMESSVSTPSPRKSASFPEKTFDKNMGESLLASVDEPIKLAGASTTPLADHSVEDHAPSDLHAADDAQGSSMSDTTKFLNVGSALHVVGTCVPCKFSLTKQGCTIGVGCNFCHYPHEGVTRNSLRKRLQKCKRQHDTLELGTRYGFAPLPMAMVSHRSIATAAIRY
eukprot:TRINITY_DN22681_c0_g1_i3.p1 TRINITY_DN22681_c0_g1~~TRINITY_DN22681_c0_g1_i3.p1  ORF type:complete len:192 (+),score=15.49 TRINITY_DN22681_c0_g1_i3:88-663(+)